MVGTSTRAQLKVRWWSGCPFIQVHYTLIDFGFNFNSYVQYTCMNIYIICYEETMPGTRNFVYSQYFQRSTTVMYLKFDYFEFLSSAV